MDGSVPFNLPLPQDWGRMESEGDFGGQDNYSSLNKYEPLRIVKGFFQTTSSSFLMNTAMQSLAPMRSLSSAPRMLSCPRASTKPSKNSPFYICERLSMPWKNDFHMERFKLFERLLHVKQYPTPFNTNHHRRYIISPKSIRRYEEFFLLVVEYNTITRMPGSV